MTYQILQLPSFNTKMNESLKMLSTKQKSLIFKNMSLLFLFLQIFIWQICFFFLISLTWSNSYLLLK